MPLSFVIIAVLVMLMYGFWSWTVEHGKERKEEGKPNYLRPIIIVIVSAMVLAVLWAIATGN